MLNWISRVLGLPFELPRTPSTSDHVKLVNFVQFGFKHLNRLVVGVCWCVCLLCLPWTPSGLDLDQTQCRAEQNRVEELHGAGFVPSLVALCCCPSVPSPGAPFITSSLSGFFTFILSKLHTNRDCNSEASYWSLYFPSALSPPPLVALCCSLFCLGNWEANSNMGQTHSRHIKCSAGQHRANHNNIPNAQVPMLSSTLFPFPSYFSWFFFLFYSCMQRSQSVVDHLRLRILLGFSLLICPANASTSPRAASVFVSVSIYKIVLMPD